MSSLYTTNANLKMMNESSKSHSKLLSVIFILNCLSKASVIVNLIRRCPVHISVKLWLCESEL